MSQPLLVFDVMGDVQLARGFSRFTDDIKDLRDAFKEIVKTFHKIEEKQFDTEGGYGSGGWTPLALSTIARKARGGFPDRMLVRTGDLRASVLGKGPYAIEEIRPLELRMGTSLTYARYHQQGRGVSARPVIQLTEDDKKSFMKSIQRYLVKQAKEALG